MRALMVTLLTRMQTSKTEKYVYEFVHFVLYTLAINVDGLTADFIPSAIEEIQPGYVGSRLYLPVTCMLMNDDAGCGLRSSRTSLSRRFLK